MAPEAGRSPPSMASSKATAKALYALHKARGLCVSCTQPATNGILCAYHHDYRRARKPLANRHHYEQKKAFGICAHCTAPATHGIDCAKHRDYRRSRRRDGTAVETFDEVASLDDLIDGLVELER